MHHAPCCSSLASTISLRRRTRRTARLYSPVGMQTWEGCLHQWLEAWGAANNRARDNGKLQTFYNSILGDPFELRGEKLRFCQRVGAPAQLVPARRDPTEQATRFFGGPVLLLTCAVDVHKENLAVGVFSWCGEPGSPHRLLALLESIQPEDHFSTRGSI